MVLASLITVVPGLMVWTLVTFALTFFVLRRFAFGAIQKAIDERRERVRQAVEEADKARAEARNLLEEHRKLIGAAKRDAEEILAEARRTSEAMMRRMKEETEEERQRRLEETRREIEAETRRALEEIRAEVADLSLIAAEKVARRALSEEDQRRLIEEAVGELDFSVLERAER
jgi:F-type H+-transporting ATPase subunit b